MIFSETADLVMNGTKTQTRRLAKPHDSIMLFKISTNNYGKGIYNDQMNRMRYQRGKTYAVQPARGTKSIGRILVTDIRLEPLQDISIHDAIAEGILPEGIKDPEYPTTYLMGFIKTWMRLYPTGSEFSWENNPKVVVLEFERVME
jgi:hypothetical protein